MGSLGLPSQGMPSLRHVEKRKLLAFAFQVSGNNHTLSGVSPIQRRQLVIQWHPGPASN